MFWGKQVKDAKENIQENPMNINRSKEKYDM